MKGGQKETTAQHPQSPIEPLKTTNPDRQKSPLGNPPIVILLAVGLDLTPLWHRFGFHLSAQN